MRITITALSEERYNDLMRRLDLDPSGPLVNVRRESIFDNSEITYRYSITLYDVVDITLKFTPYNLIIYRYGVIQAYELPAIDFDNVFII